MENATKFLVIAGAVLIVIVLISVGMVIVTQGENVARTGLEEFDKLKIDMINKEFYAYEGRKNGSDVQTLISKVINHNNKYCEVDGRQISLTFEEVEGNFVNPIVMEENSTEAADVFSKEAGKAKNVINTGKKYDVVISTSAALGGLVNAITISANQ